MCLQSLYTVRMCVVLCFFFVCVCVAVHVSLSYSYLYYQVGYSQGFFAVSGAFITGSFSPGVGLGQFIPKYFCFGYVFVGLAPT